MVNTAKLEGTMASPDPNYKRAGKTRYDLAQRDNGKIRVYYGVTEDGIQDSRHHARACCST